MASELHESPMCPEQVRILKECALQRLHAADEHCDVCHCETCEGAKDALVDLRLIATIESLGMKL